MLPFLARMLPHHAITGAASSPTHTATSLAQASATTSRWLCATPCTSQRFVAATRMYAQHIELLLELSDEHIIAQMFRQMAIPRRILATEDQPGPNTGGVGAAPNTAGQR